MKKLNIKRLIRELGGPAEISAKSGICRTTPYRWIRSGVISSRYLEKLKTAYDFLLDDYFEETTNDKPSTESTASLP